jgi:hypothetical protein
MRTQPTDRASFDQTLAVKDYKCSGCGSLIKKGTAMFQRPYYYHHKETGKTRLHNLEECWELWDENTIQARLQAKGVF